MRRVYRPDDAPGWRFVLWFALGGLGIGVVFGLTQHPFKFGDFVSAAAGSAILFGGITAVIVFIAKQSRLVVDGSDVVHHQFGRSQRAMNVGTGWRLISYDNGVEKSRRFIRALFDTEDKPRIMLNGSMWSIPMLTEALHPLGVKIMAQHEMFGPSSIDLMSPEQIAALSDEEVARVMKETEDPTVPPEPFAIVRG